MEAIAVAPATAAAAAAAAAAEAAASFQVGLCNNTLASLLPSLFSNVICHVRLGYLGFSIRSCGHACRISLSVS